MEKAKLYEQSQKYKAYLERTNPRENNIIVFKQSLDDFNYRTIKQDQLNTVHSVILEPIIRADKKKPKSKPRSSSKPRPKSKLKPKLPTLEVIKEKQKRAIKSRERHVKREIIKNARSVSRQDNDNIRSLQVTGQRVFKKKMTTPKINKEPIVEESKMEQNALKTKLILPSIVPRSLRSFSKKPKAAEKIDKIYLFGTDDSSSGKHVKKCMSFRTVWKEELTDKRYNIRFYWALKNLCYDKSLPSNCILNRMEAVQAVSNKLNMFFNMLIYCEVPF